MRICVLFMSEQILKRDIFDEIAKYLDTDNVIVLHGARQVGKTHILYYLENFLKSNGKNTYFFDLEDSRFVEILNSGVEPFLAFLSNEGVELEKFKNNSNKLYVFIDEIQYLTNPSSFLKLIADHHKYIQLIVSGSSSFDIKTKFADSLTGRTVDFVIYNLSFAEFLRFKNINIDLTGALSDFHIEKLISLYKEFTLYGGYPKIVLENSIERKEKYLQQIIDTYIKKDIRDLANVKDIKKFNDMLKILASQSGQLLNVANLSSVCSLAHQTTEKYLSILENTYVIKLVSPFSSNANVEVVKAPKVFFYDTGLLQMLWLKKLQNNYTGNIFETGIFAGLVKKYGADNINYWRNRNQNEIDFILMKENNILPIEVKTNFRNFKESSISFFLKKYNVPDFKVAALEGEKYSKHFAYPWEI